MFLQDVLKKLDDGQYVYIIDEYEGAVFRFEPSTPRIVYVKRKHSPERMIEWESDIAYEARLGGEFITQEEYYNY